MSRPRGKVPPVLPKYKIINNRTLALEDGSYVKASERPVRRYNKYQSLVFKEMKLGMLNEKDEEGVDQEDLAPQRVAVQREPSSQPALDVKDQKEGSSQLPSQAPSDVPQPPSAADLRRERDLFTIMMDETGRYSDDQQIKAANEYSRLALQNTTRKIAATNYELKCLADARLERERELNELKRQIAESDRIQAEKERQRAEALAKLQASSTNPNGSVTRVMAVNRSPVVTTQPTQPVTLQSPGPNRNRFQPF